MRVLSNIQPEKVFYYFEEICNIPHGSGNLLQISNYLVDFAKEHNLKYRKDKKQNVVIFKDGTKGYENSEAVILQGHMDMVCEKAPGCTKDMQKEGLDLCTENGTIFAKGTTLGGDDGIAVAYILAILSSNDIEHPPIEAIFTTDEETGMFGATFLDTSDLKAKTLLNIDSEVEGVFTVGCAGGVEAKCTLPIKREDYNGTPLKITVSGLLGGHSGVEIDKGRANANMVLSRILNKISLEQDIRISELFGGLKVNAIPNNSTAVILCKNAEKINTICEELDRALSSEYDKTDNGITISVLPCEYEKPFDEKSTQAVISLLSALPNGIIDMSFDIDGLVETSLNLGIMSTDENTFVTKYNIRSNVESKKNMLVQRISAIMKYFDGKFETYGDYPSWEFSENSKLLNIMSDVYSEQYGNAPKIETIHAGLECGIFAGKIKGLDCVSIGPDITDIHTYNEKLHIKSVGRTWELILETLKRLK
ncbi:MAG: aminoacyl-histidine dipeptidase [Oscillospiraceae bacterium]|nr:aminoacyl-histidine dipeptidase [Candidatus Ruminococcus equi]